MARPKAENSSTSVTRTRILPFGYIPISSRQLTHVSTPRADADFPVGTRNDLKGASSEGAGDAVDHFATKMPPWTKMTEWTDEGNSNCLDKEKIGILNDNAWSDMSRSPSPNYCYSTTKERRSMSPDFSQAYHIRNEIDTESFCLADFSTAGETESRLSEISDLSSRCKLSNAAESHDPINITGLLKNSAQDSTVTPPVLTWANDESDSLNFKASESTKTDNALPTAFESRLEEIFAIYSTDFARKSFSDNDFDHLVDKGYLSQRDILQEGLLDSPWDGLNFPSHFDTALFPEYVFPDTTKLQSAPSSLPSNESVEDQQWDFNFPLNSSHQVSTPSSPLGLSPAPITSSTGQLHSQRRSRVSPYTKPATSVTRYSCRKCKKYAGENGFKRKDHLVQHLRYYHALSQEDLVPGFCRHMSCSFAEGPMNGVRAFVTLRDYTKHLREAHEESLFNCSVPGCRRFGANGYSGWANLLRHVRKNHPRDVSSVVANHDYPVDCLLEK